jgi:phosphoribosyl 1,2-cyclic phosphodiesterase
MQITCWGVRGSIPAPDPKNTRYGGNTSCLSIEAEDRIVIIDAGTGIRSLGHELLGTEKEIYIVLTHVHSDHVEGFPFFKPLYEEDRTIHLLDHHYEGTTWSLLERFDGFHFPLEPSQIPATIHRVESDGVAYLNDEGFDLTRRVVNHPGGAYGYRLSLEGRSVVHIPDNEIDPPGSAAAPFEELQSFCSGADVLVHDAQYVLEDMPEKSGWGHSVLRDVCRLAQEAEVGHLAFFHHDPERSDEALDAMQEDARKRLETHGIECTAAYEGLTL